jgi:radical SAM family RiPP maturation amino acid epimerase
VPASIPHSADGILDLLGDLSSVPADYVREVAELKRVLEVWTMDPRFRERFGADPAAALVELGVSVRPDEVSPLIFPEEARAMTRAIREGRGGDYPSAPHRYRAFIAEKVRDRTYYRREAEPTHAKLAAWRRRQIHRTFGELGPAKADGLVHAPAAFELAKGCSVGCWFCGVAAEKLERTWDYDAESSALWRGALAAFRRVVGPCIRFGFCYWATDPLDNPHYEHFLVDFQQVLGRCPQTTTAMASRDLERTRGVLRLAHSLNSTVDRFSIITLKMLHQVHAAFTPEELLRVECIPQNKESVDKYRKAVAGRARNFTERRRGELVEDRSSTIACVSGFLVNMLDRSVQLVTPCNASPRWPLGYWILDRGTFTSPEELGALLEAMIERSARDTLRADNVVRLRPDVRAEVDADGRLALVSPYLRFVYVAGAAAPIVAALLGGEGQTAMDVALALERRCDIALEDGFRLLLDMFDRGLFDEEPAPPAQPPRAAHV